MPCPKSGRSAAWLARLTGGQKVGGSNPLVPTIHKAKPAKQLQPARRAFFLGVLGALSRVCLGFGRDFRAVRRRLPVRATPESGVRICKARRTAYVRDARGLKRRFRFVDPRFLSAPRPPPQAAAATTLLPPPANFLAVSAVGGGDSGASRPLVWFALLRSTTDQLASREFDNP